MDPVAAATLWGLRHLEVVLVRHGQPVPMAQRAPGERGDPPLSAVGERQAEAAAAAFPAGSVDAVYTSDLRRARRTAQVLAARHARGAVVVAGLREVEVPDTGSRPDGVPVEAWERASREFVDGGRWAAFTSPAAALGFRRRVRETFDGLLRSHRAGERIAVVCHSGVINRYLADVLSIERDYFFRPLHASFTRVWHDGGRSVLHSVNETAHLGAALLSG